MSSLARMKRHKVEVARSEKAFVEKHSLFILTAGNIRGTNSVQTKCNGTGGRTKKAQLQQEAIRREGRMKFKNTNVSREEAETKAELIAAFEAEARFLQYDVSQALGNRPGETKYLPK